MSPEQFEKLATKEDLKNLREEFVTKDEFNDRMDAVMNVLDHVVKTLDDMKTDQTNNVMAHDRFQEKTDNHEIRIVKLEANIV